MPQMLFAHCCPSPLPAHTHACRHCRRRLSATHPCHLLTRSEARDIAQPSRTASESSERRGRLLRLALTDGKARCVALELQPLPLSAEQARPPLSVGFRGKPGERLASAVGVLCGKHARLARVVAAAGRQPQSVELLDAAGSPTDQLGLPV